MRLYKGSEEQTGHQVVGRDNVHGPKESPSKTLRVFRLEVKTRSSASSRGSSQLGALPPQLRQGLSGAAHGAGGPAAHRGFGRGGDTSFGRRRLSLQVGDFKGPFFGIFTLGLVSLNSAGNRHLYGPGRTSRSLGRPGQPQKELWQLVDRTAETAQAEASTSCCNQKG